MSLNYIHDCGFINNSSFVHADTPCPVQWRPLVFRLLRLASLLLVQATMLESESTASGFDITGAKSLPRSIDVVIATSCRVLDAPVFDSFFHPLPAHFMPTTQGQLQSNLKLSVNTHGECTG